MIDELNWDRDVKPALDQAKAGYREGRSGWVPCSGAMAEYFLGAVPPAWQGRGAFATGEPHDHNAVGRPVYLCFRDWRGVGAVCRICTVGELQDAMAGVRA